MQAANLIVLLSLALIAKTIVNKKKTEKSNKRAFECGFINNSTIRIPFSMQFFVVAVLFLIFDIEIAVLIPFPIEPPAHTTVSVVRTFLILLGAGLLYE
jgi:NADH-ubiquinone oxidoreductase chain 3